MDKQRMPCDEPGCTSTDTIACFLMAEDEPDGYYCAEHAAGSFCLGCGQFWAGNESFDFNPRGLCDNCDVEIDDPDDDATWPFAPFDDLPLPTARLVQP